MSATTGSDVPAQVQPTVEEPTDTLEPQTVSKSDVLKVVCSELSAARNDIVELKDCVQGLLTLVQQQTGVLNSLHALGVRNATTSGGKVGQSRPRASDNQSSGPNVKNGMFFIRDMFKLSPEYRAKFIGSTPEEQQINLQPFIAEVKGAAYGSDAFWNRIGSAVWRTADKGRQDTIRSDMRAFAAQQGAQSLTPQMGIDPSATTQVAPAPTPGMHPMGNMGTTPPATSLPTGFPPSFGLSTGVPPATSLPTGFPPSVGLSTGTPPATSLPTGVPPAVGLPTGIPLTSVGLPTGVPPAVSLSTGVPPAVSLPTEVKTTTPPATPQMTGLPPQLPPGTTLPGVQPPGSVPPQVANVLQFTTQ